METKPIAPGQTWRLTFGEILGRNKAGDFVAAPEPWGSGQRWLVVLRAGGKWITACDIHTMHKARLHVEDWSKCRPLLDDANRRAGYRRLEARRRALKRLGAWKGTKELNRLLRALNRSTRR